MSSTQENPAKEKQPVASGGHWEETKNGFCKWVGSTVELVDYDSYHSGAGKDESKP